jgi:hypothetical protein
MFTNLTATAPKKQDNFSAAAIFFSWVFAEKIVGKNFFEDYQSEPASCAPR